MKTENDIKEDGFSVSLLGEQEFPPLLFRSIPVEFSCEDDKEEKVEIKNEGN